MHAAGAVQQLSSEPGSIQVKERGNFAQRDPPKDWAGGECGQSIQSMLPRHPFIELTGSPGLHLKGLDLTMRIRIRAMSFQARSGLDLIPLQCWTRVRRRCS
jgi:hypothetical protein